MKNTVLLKIHNEIVRIRTQHFVSDIEQWDFAMGYLIGHGFPHYIAHNLVWTDRVGLDEVNDMENR